MPVVLNAKLCGTDVENAAYVGRPTKWGNPFAIGRDGNRAEVIAKYEAWIIEQPELITAASSLRGKNLICWCAPQQCHAEILMAIANRPLTRDGWWLIGDGKGRYGERVVKGIVVNGRNSGRGWSALSRSYRARGIRLEHVPDWTRDTHPR